MERNSKEVIYEGTPAGGQIIAILIGHLIQQGKSVGAVGGSVQFMGGGSELAGPRMILPYIEQDNL